jgi:nitrite reductase/ring-hydroxylating ferredoxin subunit
MTYLKNIWYMAGWSEELHDQLISRRIFDRQIVMFRKDNGDVAALADRCPHRFAPLSKGEKAGDAIMVSSLTGPGHASTTPFLTKFPLLPRFKAGPWLSDMT